MELPDRRAFALELPRLQKAEEGGCWRVVCVRRWSFRDGVVRRVRARLASTGRVPAVRGSFRVRAWGGRLGEMGSPSRLLDAGRVGVSMRFVRVRAAVRVMQAQCGSHEEERESRHGRPGGEKLQLFLPEVRTKWRVRPTIELEHVHGRRCQKPSV